MATKSQLLHASRSAYATIAGTGVWCSFFVSNKVIAIQAGDEKQELTLKNHRCCFQMYYQSQVLLQVSRHPKTGQNCQKNVLVGGNIGLEICRSLATEVK